MEIDNANIYYLNGKGAIVKAKNGTKMKGLRGYFMTSESAGSQKFSISIDGEVVTSVDGVSVDEETGVAGNGEVRIYDTAGQYLGSDLDRLPKGIYIVNGKKIIK